MQTSPSQSPADPPRGSRAAGAPPEGRTGGWHRFWDWLWYGEVGLKSAQKALQLQHTWDERGVRIHLFAALFLCFFLAFPTTWVELAGGPIVLIWVLRQFRSWRLLWRPFMQPHMVLAAAFVAWEFVTFLWTPDTHLGLKQVAMARWSWIVLVIWPVIEYRMALVYALAAGFLCANLGQVLHAVGKAWEIPLFVWGRLDDRNSAWWAPVVGGTMLTAALGLHIPAAALGRGRERLIGVLCAAVTFAGVIATGTRGAWIASAMLVAIGVLAAAWRAKRRGFAGAVVVVLLGLGVCLPLVSGPVARRVDLARQEITTALKNGDFNTSIGIRLLMIRWAAEACVEHPLEGVGVGGYPGWVREHLSQQGTDPTGLPIYVHAHNTFLHIAATTGLVGLVLALALTVVVLRQGARAARNDPGNMYALGPLFGLIGLILVSPFDTIHVNMQTTAMLSVLIALCPAWMPGKEAGGQNSGPGAGP